MKYANREMKIDQIFGYFNSRKINLIPPFQRGTVWLLPARRSLIENMVQGKPVPAVFLYKQENGDNFEYNILDGKQRLESLLLFIGNSRPGMKIKNVEHFFYGKPAWADVNFDINLNGKKVSFKDLDAGLVRSFKEFPIATIEIDLDDESASLTEVIDLFIDINQSGTKVSRFDVVKALGDDPLFQQVFGLFAKKEGKRKSSYYKFQNNSYSTVMSNLNIVSRLSDENAQVDRAWEKLTEIALFSRGNQHRAPAGILKTFINAGSKKNKILNKAELVKLRSVFGFLENAYASSPSFAKSKLATDQPQFYTLITTLLSKRLLDTYTPSDLKKRLYAAAQLLADKAVVPVGLTQAVADFRLASTKQTTNPNRRTSRETSLMKVIENV